MTNHEESGEQRTQELIEDLRTYLREERDEAHSDLQTAAADNDERGKSHAWGRYQAYVVVLLWLKQRDD